MIDGNKLDEAHNVILAGCNPKTTLMLELNGSSTDERKTKCARQADPVSVGPKFLD